MQKKEQNKFSDKRILESSGNKHHYFFSFSFFFENVKERKRGKNKKQEEFPPCLKKVQAIASFSVSFLSFPKASRKKSIFYLTQVIHQNKIIDTIDSAKTDLTRKKIYEKKKVRNVRQWKRVTVGLILNTDFSACERLLHY